ncbi:hypothetical protein [Rhodospirillum sp. A1_3_36]|uniref:hypothetical protein n=1 Tax=Rhodospirillum sp. A1_3_36 TaxID=3391666 RepID=UPI0039A4DE37
MVKVEQKITQIVPAAPGWKLCELIGQEDDTNDIGYMDVVAWLVIAEYSEGAWTTSSLPVVADSEICEGSMLLRRPDGKFTHPDSCYLETEEEAIKYMENGYSFSPMDPLD